MLLTKRSVIKIFPLLTIIASLSLGLNPIKAQELKEYNNGDYNSRAKVYEDSEGNLYAKTINVRFKKHLTENELGANSANLEEVKPATAEHAQFIRNLRRQFGSFKIKKTFPDSERGDTKRTNIRTGKPVEIVDFTLILDLVFKKPVEIEKIVKFIKGHEIVESASGPAFRKSVSYDPDDPVMGTTNYSAWNTEVGWYMDKIKLRQAWKAARGYIYSKDRNIKVGVPDGFGTGLAHQDLKLQANGGNIHNYLGSNYSMPSSSGESKHGIAVSSFIGATADNGIGVTGSLWDVELIPAPNYHTGFEALINNSDQNEIPDVINCSWIHYDDSPPYLEAEVESALEMGIVVVASSGNRGIEDGVRIYDLPNKVYPAAYEFSTSDGDDVNGQVIAVAASGYQPGGTYTDKEDGNTYEYPSHGEFVYDSTARQYGNYTNGNYAAYEYNFSPGSDPESNPESAFIDITAPGLTVHGADNRHDYGTNSYKRYWGTSFAAPIVSSVVGMILSVNPSLTPQEVYDILTKTADRLPKYSATYTHSDGIRKWDKRTGYGRLNAFDAVIKALPDKSGTLYSATTFSRPYHIDGDLKLDAGHTYQIDPGVSFFLDGGTKLVVRNSSQLIAEGTENKPIRFESDDLNANSYWKSLVLRSDRNDSFKWCLFDGGNELVRIRSDNNTFEHCTFRNAVERGISSGSNVNDDTNAEATLTNCRVEQNETVGIVSYYADMDISNTTVQDNGQAGIWVYGATIDPFHHNLVQDNGKSDPGRAGVEVNGTGSLFMREGSSNAGYNKVWNNPDDQLVNDGDLQLFNVPEYTGGRNTVTDSSYGNGKYFIDNNSSSTVYAMNCYWGPDPVSSSMFSGSVDYSAPLSSDPTGSSTGDGDDVPSQANPSGTPLLVGNESDQSVDTRYENTKQKLLKAKTSSEIKKHFYDLYLITRLSEDGEINGRFSDLTDTYAKAQPDFYEKSSHNGEFQKQARILRLKYLTANAEYDKAASVLETTNPSEFEKREKATYLILKQSVEQRQHKYQESWNTLNTYYDHLESMGHNKDELRSRYAIVEKRLAGKIDGVERESIADSELLGSNETEDNTSSSISIAAHPNPFNPTTTFTVTLEEASQATLKVYNTLGQEVATLHNGRLSAGKHRIQFNATGLSSGLYIYRLNTGGEVYTNSITLLK